MPRYHAVVDLCHGSSVFISLSPLKTNCQVCFGQERWSRLKQVYWKKSRNLKISHFGVAVWEGRDVISSKVSPWPHLCCHFKKETHGLGRKSGSITSQCKEQKCMHISGWLGCLHLKLVCKSRVGPILPHLLVDSHFLSGRIHRTLISLLIHYNM